MKTRLALITLMATMFMALAITPVHAGKVAMGNSSTKKCLCNEGHFYLARR